MRSLLRPVIVMAIGNCLGLASPALAARFTATSTNLASVFAAASDGDTIVLSGRFGATLLSGRSFATPLRIDARAARFDGTLSIRDMRGLSISGGLYGSPVGSWQDSGTIRVADSAFITFTRPRLIGDGLGKARGLMLARTDNFSVEGGSFSGFRLALGGSATTNGLFLNNRITRSTSDGINIVDSHFVTARGNACSGGIPSAGAHPDCIQLWSVAGNPVQSDIKLLYNTALGATQGFTSFNPENGGGLRISMIGNRVDTSFPQGIACYGCVDSIITDNVLTTLPGSKFRTALRVIGGSNNIVENNSVEAYVAPKPLVLTDIAPQTFVTSAFDGDIFDQFEQIEGQWGPAAAAAVPEPGVWLQLLTGFALLGSWLRQRRGSAQMRPQKIG